MSGMCGLNDDSGRGKEGGRSSPLLVLAPAVDQTCVFNGSVCRIATKDFVNSVIRTPLGPSMFN